MAAANPILFEHNAKYWSFQFKPPLPKGASSGGSEALEEELEHITRANRVYSKLLLTIMQAADAAMLEYSRLFKPSPTLNAAKKLHRPEAKQMPKKCEASTASGQRKLFLACKPTPDLQAAMSDWFAKEHGGEIVASVPPNSRPSKGDQILAEDCAKACKYVAIDMPAYGPVMHTELKNLFDLLKPHADKLGIKLRDHCVNKMVIKKMDRVLLLSDDIRRSFYTDLPADHEDKKNLGEAIKKLNSFAHMVKDFDLRPDDQKTKEGFETALGEVLGQDMSKASEKKKLDIEVVLTIFGFRDCKHVWHQLNAAYVQGNKFIDLNMLPSEDQAKYHAEENGKLVDAQGNDVTWQDYSLKWLANGFTAFGFDSSLADVVNCICAMMQTKDRRKTDGNKTALRREAEDAVTDLFNYLNMSKEQRKTSEGPSPSWVPTHIVHDGKWDDLMTLLLVHHVAGEMGKPLPAVLVQLTTSEMFDVQYQDLQGMIERGGPRGKVVNGTRSFLKETCVFRDTSIRFENSSDNSQTEKSWALWKDIKYQ